MSVFRTKKVKNFTVMSNNHLKQPDLSFKARGILSTMLAYPDDWEFSIEGLAKMASDGIKSTRSGVNEL
ncbi:MAG: helix-turn-helix domain-containing protein, partial [Firmicutes bacterium]|nr:helix-turn-helix domain-containing protein [Bacillota bacterium]